LSQYYYTISSLPFLLFGDDAPLTSDEFFQRCEVELSEEQVSELLALKPGLEPDSGASELVNKWTEWDFSLRNELVRLRAKDLSLDETSWLRESGSIPDVEDVARTAFKKDSPLEAEVYLDKERWTFLDWQKTGHIFDYEALVIYCLQLGILERQSSFNVEAGFERYKQIYSNVLSNVNEQNVE